MARDFYKSEKVLLVVPLPRGEELRVLEGTKADGTVYMDLRTWYRDDNDQLCPGKGIGRPDNKGLWQAIAKAILERPNETLCYSTKLEKYIPLEDE